MANHFHGPVVSLNGFSVGPVPGGFSQDSSDVAVVDGSGNVTAANLSASGNLAVTGNATISGNLVVTGQVSTAVVTLTAAQVVAMYTTPVQLVAAITGSTIMPIKAQVAIASTGHTAFSSGGAAIIQWGNTTHGGGTQAMTGTIAAGNITSASNSNFSLSGLGDVTTTVTTGAGGLGLFLSNATQVFAGGTGSTLVVVLSYVVVPVSV
jgi:hypothetical protein